MQCVGAQIQLGLFGRSMGYCTTYAGALANLQLNSLRFVYIYNLDQELAIEVFQYVTVVSYKLRCKFMYKGM